MTGKQPKVEVVCIFDLGAVARDARDSYATQKERQSMSVTTTRIRIAAVMSLGVLSFIAGTAAAQPVVNGTAAGDPYGPALSIQNTNTQFGNATNGDPRVASGSEIDQVFGLVSGGRLYVLIAGNFESNFARLEVFIDSTPGGVNMINGANLPGGVDPFCCGGFPPPNGTNAVNAGALQRMHGLTFDSGFFADRYLTFTNGTESVGSPPISFWALSAHYADLTNGVAGNTVAVGMQLNAFGQEPLLAQGVPVDRANNAWSSPTDFGALPAEHEMPEDVIPGTNNARNHRNYLNTTGLRMGMNNSNAAGVVGSGPYNIPTTGNPRAVLTGVEFSIPLSELGNPTGSIKLVAFINGSGHDYASNQFAGVGILNENLGGNGLGGFTGDLSGVNMNNYVGNQFVTIPIPVPCPADTNADGVVNVSDLLAVISAWGPCPPPPAACDADINQSGTVDVSDLLAVIGAWGDCP